MNKLRKVVSLLLSFIMVVSLFSGLTFFEAKAEVGDVIVATRSEKAIDLKTNQWYQYGSTYAHLYIDSMNTESVVDVPTEPDTLNAVYRLHNDTDMTDVTVVSRYTGISYSKTTDEAIMLYLELPKCGSTNELYNKYWGLVDGTWVNITEIDYAYLAIDSNVWVKGKTTAQNGNYYYDLPDGFKGYLKLYIETAASISAESFGVQYLQFGLTNFGGEYGDFVLGGMYTISHDSDSTNASIRQAYGSDSYSDYSTASLTNWTSETGKTVFSYKDISVYSGNPVGEETTERVTKLGVDSAKWYWGETYDALAQSRVLSSDKAVGMALGNSVDTVNTAITTYLNIYGQKPILMFYMETPEYAEGSDYAVRFNSLWFTDSNGTNAWGRLRNTDIKYLSVDGTSWISGKTGENEELYLPSGFKGYVKVYLDTAFHDIGTNQTLFQYFDSVSGFEYTSNFNINNVQLAFNYLGGEYGDCAVGFCYEKIVEDGESMLARGTANGMTYEISFSDYEPTFTAERKRARNVNDVSEGEIVDYDIARKDDGTYSFVWSNAYEPDTNNASMKLSLDEATGEYGIQSAIWLKVQPEVGAIMLYMELPQQNGDLWTIRTAGSGFGQDGTTKTWAQPVYMKYAYLEKRSEKWIETKTGPNGEFYLPDGFQGYIKCYLNDAYVYDNASFISLEDKLSAGGIDTNAEYTVDYLSVKLQHVGGAYGDFILGGEYYVLEDSNNLYGLLSDEGKAKEYCKLTNAEIPLSKSAQNVKDLISEIDVVDITDINSVDELQARFLNLSERDSWLLSKNDSNYKNVIENIISEYNVYRPTITSTVRNNPYGDDQALRFDSQLNGATTVPEGFTVKNSGIVISENLPEDEYFTDKAAETVEYKSQNEDALVVMETNEKDSMEKNLYVRSYVTYQDAASKEYVVWNTMNTKGNHSIPYYQTSLLETANGLGMSVLNGADYGDVDFNGEVLMPEDLAALRDEVVGARVNLYTYVSDLNDDDTVNVQDVVRFKRKDRGEIVSIGATPYSRYETVGEDVFIEQSTKNVYVSDAGNDNNIGTDLLHPYGTLSKALDVVEDGGKIVVCDNYTAPSGFQWKEASSDNRTITIEGLTKDTMLDFTKVAGNIIIGNNVKFDKMKLEFGENKNVFANGHKLEIGEQISLDKPINLYGGGYQTEVQGTDITVKNGNYYRIFGGGYEGTVTGNTKVYVGGTANSKANPASHDYTYLVYGGGNNCAITGETNVTFTDNAQANYIYGGSSGSNSSVAGTNVTFSGQAKAMSLYGGNNVATLNGNVKVSVTGGELEQLFGANEGANMTGNVDIELTGGKITRRVYGGCYNNVSSDGLSVVWNTKNYVHGNVNLKLFSGVTISLDAKDPEENQYEDLSIYACSRLAPKNSNETCIITFMDQTAYDSYYSKLGAHDWKMRYAMNQLSTNYYELKKTY